MHMRHKIIILMALFLMVLSHASFAASYYDLGSPVLTEIWVNPVNGKDINSGTDAGHALRTITEAWNRIPGSGVLTTGYRINLMQGTFPCEPGPERENCVNYFSSRTGTYQTPIIIRAYNGPGTVTVRGGFDLNNVHYLYLIDLDFVGGSPLPTNISGNNLLHLADSDHILLRGLSLTGPSCANDSCNNLQEVLKVNQTQYLYVEDSIIGGAWHSSVDYMVVQYGHFLNNRVHTAGQWGMYVKGGSSYLRVEGNEFYNCQLGFSAGQAANLAVMRSPWLHYDAYDIKFVNNVLHDIPGVGIQVAGGYNILLAHNTLYRVGISEDPGYGLMQFVRGERGCNPTDDVTDPVSACNALIGQGGWGPNFLTDSVEAIPNKNVYVYNNIFYNPLPTRTLYSNFGVYGPISPPAGFMNIPAPSRTDDNLAIRGNLIWNGSDDHPLGIEETDQGCQNGNPTCNASQLRSDNAINTVEPQFINPSNDDFHPLPGGTIFAVQAESIPGFTWSDAPVSPPVPQGELVNIISSDRDGLPRTATNIPGAYGVSSGFSVTPTNRDVAGNAGTTGFNVTCTGNWSAQVTSGGEWLSIKSGAGGSNAGTIACAFLANITPSVRIGTIRVTATGATSSPVDVTVTQAETPEQPNDLDGDGYTENQGDCNDNNNTVYPGGIEICGDGIDQDCNGSDLPCGNPPAAPTGITASDGTLSGKIQVSWIPSTGAEFYDVYRANMPAWAGGTPKRIALSVSGTSYDDTSAVSGSRYYYWVKAKNSGGGSGYSMFDPGYWGPEGSISSAPINVSASDGTVSGKVNITWNAVPNALIYEIYRADIPVYLGGSIKNIGTSATTSYNDATVVNGNQYYYWVKSRNSWGGSGYSKFDTGYIGTASPLLSAPTGVSATDGTVSGKVKLTWIAVSGSLIYEVWRATQPAYLGGKPALMGTVKNNGLSYDDASMTCGTTYYYWVKARNSWGSSGYSTFDSGYCTGP